MKIPQLSKPVSPGPTKLLIYHQLLKRDKLELRARSCEERSADRDCINERSLIGGHNEAVLRSRVCIFPRAQKAVIRVRPFLFCRVIARATRDATD